MSDTGFLTPTANESNGGWVNPANMETEDGVFSTNTSTNTTVNQYDFGFSIPVGASIQGIEVAVKGLRSSSQHNCEVELLYNSRATAAPTQEIFNLPTTNIKTFVGGATSKWGRASWAVSDFSNANFAVRVGSGFPAFGTGSIDVVEVKVYYTTGWAGKWNGEDSANLASIDGELLANIAKVDGV